MEKGKNTSRDKGKLSRAAGVTMIGVTMIEVMVSLLILAIGLLGVSALHGLSIKSGTRSYYRSQAVSQSYDILDRMRANPAGAAAGAYSQTDSSASENGGCEHSPCSAADVARSDIRQWNEATGSLLPSGAGTISLDESGVRVVIDWQEHPGPAQGGGSASISTGARL